MTAASHFDFFYDAGSCSLAVRIALEELKLPYVAHRVTARDAADEASQPLWRARNPKGRVPALAPVAGRAGGEALLLTEVPAILTYLARLRPASELVPSDPAREARVIEWTNWLSGWLHGVAFGGLWRPGRFTDDARAHASVTERGRRNVIEAFRSIETILGDGRRWAVPDSYTIADIFLLVFHRWGAIAGIDMEEFPAWVGLMQRLLDRSAVAAAFAKEELSLPRRQPVHAP